MSVPIHIGRTGIVEAVRRINEHRHNVSVRKAEEKRRQENEALLEELLLEDATYNDQDESDE